MTVTRIVGIAGLVGLAVACAVFAHGAVIDPFVPAPDIARALARSRAVEAGTTAAAFTAMGCWLVMRRGPARRRRIEAAAAAVLVAAAGFVVSLVFERLVNPGDAVTESLRIAAFAALGGALAGGLGAPWLGRRGRRGWIVALLAAYAVTVLAGALAGTAMWPGLGTMAGTVTGALAPVARPTLLAVRIACLVSVQVAMIALRRRLDRRGPG